MGGVVLEIKKRVNRFGKPETVSVLLYFSVVGRFTARILYASIKPPPTPPETL